MNIDNSFLEELGLGAIPEDEKLKMLADIYESLQEKIGARTETELDEAQQDELDQLIDNNPSEVSSWLENNLPNYQQIVSEEIDNLKAEIRPQVPGILQSLNLA